MAIGITQDSNFDFPNFDHTDLIHTVKDVQTGRTWDFHSVSNNNVHTVDEPETWFLLLTSMLIVLFIITRKV
ncbi:MAG: hypothetical protein R3B60_03695 [Candidatus Paceibacterota bacterium]